MELMQREDFMALCKGPKNGGVFYWSRGSKPGQSGFAHSHCGMGPTNQARILEDWFPAGTIFEFLGTTCFSRGFDRDRGSCYSLKLRVTAPSPKGGMEDVFFSVKEALNIARQISVDRVNFLNALPYNPDRYRKD